MINWNNSKLLKNNKEQNRPQLQQQLPHLKKENPLLEVWDRTQMEQKYLLNINLQIKIVLITQWNLINIVMLALIRVEQVVISEEILIYREQG